MLTFHHLPTSVTAEQWKPGVDRDDVMPRRRRPGESVSAYLKTGSGKRVLMEGDYIVTTPAGCTYTIARIAFDRLYAKLDTPESAARLLAHTLRAISAAGFTITGLNIDAVNIVRDGSLPLPLGEVAASAGEGSVTPALAPDPLTIPQTLDPNHLERTGPIPAAPPGFTGNISACCSAPTEQRGTCEYCTSCGSSDGCS